MLAACLKPAEYLISPSVTRRWSRSIDSHTGHRQLHRPSSINSARCMKGAKLLQVHQTLLQVAVPAQTSSQTAAATISKIEGPEQTIGQSRDTWPRYALSGGIIAKHMLSCPLEVQPRGNFGLRGFRQASTGRYVEVVKCLLHLTFCHASSDFEGDCR
jgi:hypothetical protein